MTTSMKRKARNSSFISLAIAAVGTLVLTGCAGGAGGAAGGGAGGGGEGVEAGASLEDYKEALADMPETTLVYQPTEPSPEGLAAARALAFKENVEEGSGGKITVDLVWGQAIAGFSELPDALVDGRVDIAYTLPMYQPSEYPVTDAFVAGSTLTGSSPRAGDLIANAAMLELAWNSEELIDEFESKGLNVLMPFHADGNVLTMCTDPGVAPTDWKGRQVRISSSAQEEQLTALGGAPVSMEYVESYEALQRGAIDCTLSAGVVAVGNGFMEIAPHFSYSEDASFARGAGAIMAGSDFEQLPLAAQQLIFDQMEVVFEKGREVSLQGNIEAAKAAKAQDGSIEVLDAAVEQELVTVSEDIVDQAIERGSVPEDFKSDIYTALDKWQGIVEEMGLEDKGSFEDFDEWHTSDEVDLAPFAQRVYDEIMKEHRPG